MEWFSQAVIGASLNVAGIVAGGLAGLAWRKPLSSAFQNYLKLALGAFALWIGFRLTWLSLHGPFLVVVKQLGIVLVAMMIGKLAGRGLGLQRASNRIGHFARDQMGEGKPADAGRQGRGFRVCSALFCAAPLAILGAVQDGLSGYFYPLALKAVMDGLAMMGFATMFGWGTLFSAVPVFILEGGLAYVCYRWLGPFLVSHALVDPVNATGGLLVVAVALVILQVKRIEITDYLPSLLFAPLLSAWLKWGG